MFVFLETLRFVLVDVLLEVIYFPIWYYTSGTLKVLRQMGKHLRALAASLNLRILWKFLLQPMYGQTDIWGRIISLVMRVLQFIVLSLLSLIYSLVWLVVLVLWLILPVIIIAAATYHLGWWTQLPWLTAIVSNF